MSTENEEKDEACEKEKPQERSYYYDDAHGYEDYDPEADEADNDEEGEVTPESDPAQR